MNNTTRGFTLIEVMVTVAIIAIIAAVATGSYSRQVGTVKDRAEGQAHAMAILQAQERYYSENYTYTNDLTDLGFSKEFDLPSDQSNFLTTAGVCPEAAPYNVITACVLVQSVPQGSQATNGEGTITIDSLGNQSW